MLTGIPLFIVPILLVLFLVEVIYSYKEEKHLYQQKDTLSNIVVGIGFFLSNLLSKIVMLFAFQFIYRFHLLKISDAWYIGIIAFLACDFSYYWFHRASHEISWFWAAHVVHHSSEQYNLSVALRLPWTMNITGQYLFWIWMPLLGFSPIMTIVCLEICLYYQAFLHTETIKKLPALVEYIFNTPSHHRVHHSSNFKYLDKNHSGVLMIWDKIFGTFQEEEEKPVYGLTKKIESHNPVVIVFHEWIGMFKKAVRGGSVRNAINYIIQPPGWSHDGSSKTVKQLRKANTAFKTPHKKCNHDCSKCPFKLNPVS